MIDNVYWFSFIFKSLLLTSLYDTYILDKLAKWIQDFYIEGIGAPVIFARTFTSTWEFSWQRYHVFSTNESDNYRSDLILAGWVASKVVLKGLHVHEFSGEAGAFREFPNVMMRGSLWLTVLLFLLVKSNCITLDLLQGECISFLMNACLNFKNEWMCYK